MNAPPRALVIGIGNMYRQDDGAGLAVAARVRLAAPPGVQTRELGGELVTLLDMWGDAPVVYLADAVRSGGTPGRVYRFDARAGMPPAGPFGHRGTHTFSVADTIELARSLGRLPGQLIGYGIEGADFGNGTSMSPEVASAVHAVTTRLLAELSAGAAR